MAVQSLGLAWREIAAGPKQQTFHPVSAWYRVHDLASIAAQMEVAAIAVGARVVPAVEIHLRPTRQVLTIGRRRSSTGSGDWQKRALVRKKPFLVRAGWVVTGPSGANARVRGEIALRHSGAGARAVLDLVRHSIGKDRKPDEPVIRELLDVIFPQVARSGGRASAGGPIDVDCAVESCEPHNCTDNYTIGGDPACPSEGSCDNDDCQIVICRDGYECSGGNTCAFLGCDGQYSYVPPCQPEMYGETGGPGCMIDWGGAGGPCWIDVTPPPTCEGLHVTHCEGLVQQPCQPMHVNCGDIIVRAPCEGVYVTSPKQQREGATWVLVGQLLRKRRKAS